MEQIFQTHSTQETEELAAKLSGEIGGFVAIYGPMGAGKTAFVRGFVNRLCPTARVSSPTYTVMNVYEDRLYHLDLYRLTGDDDLESIGFFDIPKDATVLCEWAEHLPEDVRVDVRVVIEPVSFSDERVIKVVK